MDVPVSQHNMDFMKPEPDEESYLASSGNKNQLVDVKEDEDAHLMKFPVSNSENEVSLLYVCTSLHTMTVMYLWPCNPRC
jgi:hypothetical protein